MEPEIKKWTIRGVVAFFAILAIWILWPLRVVPVGHMGVIAWFGKVDPVPVKAGLQIVAPLSKVHNVDIQILKHDSKGEAASKDLQAVHTTITANFNVVASEAAKLYSEIGMGYEEKIFDGAVQETFKAITANYTAEELIKKREQVTGEITQLFKQKITHLSGGTIRIDAVFIKNFQFGAAFNKAIEEKQVAEQTALKASRDLERIKIEADQVRAKAKGEADAAIAAAHGKSESTILNAKAEAEAFRLKSIQITDKMIQMAAIEKWDGNLPLYMGSSAPMPFVDVPKGRPSKE